MTTDVLILGSGPAGMTAALYCARFGLATLALEGVQPGGQLTTTSTVENFPGFEDGIDGGALVDKMKAQALKFGAQINYGTVTAIEKTEQNGKQFFSVTIDGKDLVSTRAIIIATGASAKYLNLPDEATFKGKGISTCAVCDGFFYRKKDVAVIGGGDSALEEALFLANICANVHLIVRKPYMRAAQVLQGRLRATSNIHLHLLSNVVALHGKTNLQGTQTLDAITVKTDTADGSSSSLTELPVSGLFEAIGHQPNTAFLQGIVELDPQGYIKVQSPSTATSQQGIFAAGDVADPHYQQAINAAASGCRAAFDTNTYLQNH